MKSIVAIAFGLLLVVQAQVMLPHRKAINSGNPFNAGPNGTNLLGGAIGEQPVLFSNQLYLANWSYYGGTSGLSVVDCETVQTVKFVQVTNSWTAHAPLQDKYGKWHLWASDGALFRIDVGASNVEEVKVSGTFRSNDWETICFCDKGEHIVVPRSLGTHGDYGIMAISVTNYSVAIWTNTTVQYSNDTSRVLTPSILYARSNLWVQDHSTKLWKLDPTDGSVVGSVWPYNSNQGYQYSCPVYDPDNDQVYYSDANHATLYAVNPDTMVNKWSCSVADTHASTANWWAWRPACYYQNRVYFLADWRTLTPHCVRVMCINATNGVPVWQNDYAMEHQLYCGAPFMDNDYFYLSTYDEIATNLCNLVAMDRTTGRTVGLFHEDFNASSGIPQEWKGKIFMPHWENHGIQAVKFRASGLPDDKSWKANTNYTGNVGANGSGAILYPTNLYNLPSGCQAYWRMDETTGDRVDLINSTALTPTASVNYNAGTLVTNSVHFPTGHYLSANSGPSFVLGTSGYTITLWVRWTGWNSAAASQVIFRKGDAGGTDYLFQGLSSYDGGANQYRWVDVASSGAYGINSTRVTLSNDGWDFICIWDDRANNKVWIQVNMLTPESVAVTGTPSDAGRPFKMSSVNGASNYMIGDVDEFAIWDRALTVDERTALYNMGSGRPF